VGYTHYWSIQRSHPVYSTSWPGIIDDTRRIIDAVRATGIGVAGPHGHGQPILDPAEGIAFNGDASIHRDYETFRLAPPAPEPGHRWAFCKTGHRPYDLAVTAVLLRCRLLLPDVFLLASDGRWDGAWAHSPLADSPGADGTSPRRLVSDLFGDVPATSPFHIGTLPGTPSADEPRRRCAD
jgi:hypothetical protein